MHFWSEGLGNRELVIGLDRSKIERKGEVILLSGVVDSPAPWEYEVKVAFDDWQAILKTATTNEACDFIASHARWRMLSGIAWSIVKFVVLLAMYRSLRILGLARIDLTPAKPLESDATKKA